MMSYKSNKKGTIDSRPEFEFVYVRHSFFLYSRQLMINIHCTNDIINRTKTLFFFQRARFIEYSADFYNNITLKYFHTYFTYYSHSSTLTLRLYFSFLYFLSQLCFVSI